MGWWKGVGLPFLSRQSVRWAGEEYQMAWLK